MGEGGVEKASLQNLIRALVLLIAIGLLGDSPASAAPDNLIDASAAGDLAQVNALLATNADVNAKLTDGSTPLILASQNGRMEVVQALLARNADVNSKLADGFTALIVASQNGHLEVVQLLRPSSALGNVTTLPPESKVQSCSVSDSVTVDLTYRQMARAGLERDSPGWSEELLYSQAKEDNLRYLGSSGDRVGGFEGS